MKNRNLQSLLLAGAVLTLAPALAAGASFDLSTVVDTNTPVPGGTGTFTCLRPTGASISGEAVAFWGSAFQPPFFCKPSGIYRFVDGRLARVADEQTIVPGTTGTFTGFDDPVVSDDRVAFAALGPGARAGIYLFDGATLRTVANQETAVPDGNGTFQGFSGVPLGFDGGPVLSGDHVAFFGFGAAGGGIYLFDGSTLLRVVDRNTPIPPGGVGNFSGFGTVAISGDNVAFDASGESFGQVGIYLFDGARIRTVADTTTAIPGGTGSFTLFEEGPVISGDDVAFKGVGSGGQRGIYLFDGAAVKKIADTSTPIPDGRGLFTDFHVPVVGDGTVAFRGIAVDGREGIYVFDGSGLTKAADTNTAAPGATGRFTRFVGPAMNGRSAAFEAEVSSGERGVYVFNGTTLSVVADTHTIRPGSSDAFTGFSALPAMSDGNVMFGARSGPVEGLYLATAKPIGPAKLWIGLRNSDDIGLRVDLRAEVFDDGVLVASGRLDNQPAGGSGFANAALRTVRLDAAASRPALASGDALTIALSVRRTCAGGGHNSGAVRLWYGGSPVDVGRTRDAGSRFDVTVDGVNRDLFLRRGPDLGVAPASSKAFTDVFVDSARPCPDRPFAPLGAWTSALP